MELTETILTTFIGGLFGAILTVFIGYMTFRVKLESRLKDVEHKIELLEYLKSHVPDYVSRLKDLEHRIELLKPIENILSQVGSERAEKVFREADK